MPLLFLLLKGVQKKNLMKHSLQRIISIYLIKLTFCHPIVASSRKYSVTNSTPIILLYKNNEQMKITI